MPQQAKQPVTKRLSHISIGLFVTWLHRRRVQGKWHKLEPDGEDWPFGDNVEPWGAVISYIVRQTGFEHPVIEQYMSTLVRQPRKDVDPYVSRELFKWWKDGGGDKLIRKFWKTYPKVAESMGGLPKPKQGKTIQSKTKRKRAKQPTRTVLTKRESQVKLALDAGLSQSAIANKLGITEGRVSQIVKSIEQVEKAASSRSVPMGKMSLLHGDYSPDAPTPIRTRRQRKKKTN